MRPITLLQPTTLAFGSGTLNECIRYIEEHAFQSVHLLGSEAIRSSMDQLVQGISSGKSGCTVSVDTECNGEPTIRMFEAALERARLSGAECMIGMGGGSVLDLAKLVAAFQQSTQSVSDCFGIGFLHGRSCHLICIPTTSGTGSEVSPNAILLDEAEQLKKGVVSRYLVPDATFIDPELTIHLPSHITAFTGLDALTHCVEAYTNKFAHPLIDVYALEGIHLAAKYLVRAVRDGSDLEAREGMALASMLGGLCLGPVNTAAVHALAYPLGGAFHIAHGLSNAVLLAEVFRFNASASPERHAKVAAALGVLPVDTPMQTAELGAEALSRLVSECGVSVDLSEYGVSKEQVPEMALAASTVTRLLKNNPRDITVQDIESIYYSCFPG